MWKWEEEALALAAHLEYLQKRCWKAQITLSMPRLRPAAGDFEPRHPLDDRQFVQVLCGYAPGGERRKQATDRVLEDTRARPQFRRLTDRLVDHRAQRRNIADELAPVQLRVQVP